jgi:hypothetical protein
MNQKYYERVVSKRTEALFLGLTVLFLLLSLWRMKMAGLDTLTVILCILCAFFLFYSLNYRTLRIRLTTEHLELKFGLFTWVVALENVEHCFLDDTSLWRIGGAGIHFSPIHGRYRAMFNFLEYPRVVIALKRRMGLVRDIAFSTRYPNEVIEKIRAAASMMNHS